MINRIAMNNISNVGFGGDRSIAGELESLQRIKDSDLKPWGEYEHYYDEKAGIYNGKIEINVKRGKKVIEVHYNSNNLDECKITITRSTTRVIERSKMKGANIGAFDMAVKNLQDRSEYAASHG